MAKVTITGCGFSGRAIAAELQAHGVADVAGTARSADTLHELDRLGIRAIPFSGEAVPDLLARLRDTTHLVQSIAPARTAGPEPTSGAIVDPLLRALAPQALRDAMPALRWVGYLSTVGVYGDHAGAWVDETTPPAPRSERSRQRVRAENEWLALDDTGANGPAVAVLRLSGIYGPGRNAFVNARDGRARRLVKPGQVFNRIHVADIARAVRLAMEREARGVFNVTDDEPAPPQDVVLHAHELMGRLPPPEQDFATADLSPMARSFYGENKRVGNARSKRVLGMAYRFPTYRQGLGAMWPDGWE